MYANTRDFAEALRLQELGVLAARVSGKYARSASRTVWHRAPPPDFTLVQDRSDLKENNEKQALL
jgi:hypothetical protein